MKLINVSGKMINLEHVTVVDVAADHQVNFVFIDGRRQQFTDDPCLRSSHTLLTSEDLTRLRNIITSYELPVIDPATAAKRYRAAAGENG